jgi:serine/threonine protein kinase
VPANSTHWGNRLMAQKTGLSQTAIVRIWLAFGLPPHRVQNFKFSNDAQFVEQVRDIPILPLVPGVPARQTQWTSDETALARFRNEVRIARQVSHPNVCRVYDIGEAEGSTYLSIEYVEGEDLASLLRGIGRLPQDKALEIARQLIAHHRFRSGERGR